jgi:hypothetical protein
VPAQPTIVLLGAPGTGAAALAQDLQRHMLPDAVLMTCSSSPVDGTQATLTLLMGLDLPCPPGQQHAREAADACLRSSLERTGMAYHVVYGQGERRTANALRAIKTIAPHAITTSDSATSESNSRGRAARLRAWNCEKCSDPECEHRLFKRLLS